MDIFAHTLWANIIAKKANILAEKKFKKEKLELSSEEIQRKKKFHINIFWASFWGVFPDLFAFSVPFFIGFYKIISGQSLLSSFRDHHNTVSNFDLSSFLYQFGHSLIIFLLIFILIWILFRRLPYELLGWALHILIDIPSHSISFFPTPFLFPISDYRFPYGIHWANKWYMIINYSLLLIIWATMLSKKLKGKKNLL